MKHHDPKAGVGAVLRRAAPLLTLLVLAGLAAACVAAAPPAASPTAAPAPAQATATTSLVTAQPAPATNPPVRAATAQPAGAATAAGAAAVAPTVDVAKLPTGVDADGNFYRGDPKAAVKLQDFSDFQ